MNNLKEVVEGLCRELTQTDNFERFDIIFFPEGCTHPQSRRYQREPAAMGVIDDKFDIIFDLNKYTVKVAGVLLEDELSPDMVRNIMEACTYYTRNEGHFHRRAENTKKESYQKVALEMLKRAYN